MHILLTGLHYKCNNNNKKSPNTHTHTNTHRVEHAFKRARNHKSIIIGNINFHAIESSSEKRKKKSSKPQQQNLILLSYYYEHDAMRRESMRERAASEIE